MKSKMFHGSLKYAPSLNTNPRPTIFKHISIEYKARKIFSTASAIAVDETAWGSSAAKVIELAKMTVMHALSNTFDEMIFKANKLM